ncbi:acetylornithine/succinyldiaminopimelate/putrescine aminotransferase [Povalibacter uvarum]|uniref:Acetylornithine/succinyldiaminopimelate/putresci ne aminotransferase n=1 Tax=Povalibacter uvarum TaxID=732238 RepID=A0A841HI79_9GAMM|nr:aminotransferase class III-fold pyridoxal phosphate-dependent enzyme [Povalibacter uvarum]MBB6092707.1 acetylornithine/succinyldiaminopimelate/putrescine aminotransferase [Povalibacter uvarum]
MTNVVPLRPSATPAAPLQDHLAPVFAQFPLEVVDAQGVSLHTPDGRKVLDLYGGHAVAALGYNHPRWVEALTQQARQLCFQSNAVPLDVRRRAAAKLANFCGLGLDTIFFVNSGAEANENALKLAFKMTNGTEVIAVEGSFHGRTAAAGAVTWGAEKKWYGFPGKPFEVKFIKPSEAHKLATMVNDRTAAVIVEPVQGVAGALDLPKEFLQALRTRCSENGSILIFDEVQCGVGRTGYPFAANMYGITPDIITTAKALGAGFPVSAVLVADHVAEYMKIDSLGTTFGAGPMACAVVEAVIDIIESENLLENVRARSAEIREKCVVGPVVGTQGAGLLLGLRTSRPAKDVQAELLKLDILTGTSGDPNVVRILAPFVLGSEHVEQLRDALKRIGK